MKKAKKVVLAYSGGLDTSIIVPWLKQNYGNPEVICYCANLGQADELTGLASREITDPKRRGTQAKDLRPIYTTPSAVAAWAAFEEFEEKWGKPYPAIPKLWRAAWEQFIPFLDYPVELRKIVYTTKTRNPAALLRSSELRCHLNLVASFQARAGVQPIARKALYIVSVAIAMEFPLYTIR